ncbi:MAG: beta-ketoacyl synthase N-terminal-like domain-containing protein [Parahaliea sp.]
MTKLLAAGISGHLGNSLDESFPRLFRPLVKASLHHLDDFSGPLSIRYRAVDSAPQDAEQRLLYLLDQSMQQLLDAYPLSTSVRRTLPVFIGSSCYGIALAESLYRTRYTESPELAFAVPLQGFHQIHHHLRDCYRILGSDFAIHTACTSTANALLNASMAIQAGIFDHALVIGLETINTTTLSGFQAMQMLSLDEMRPFDRNRSGLILGEGCGTILLGRGEGGLTLLGGAAQCDRYSISTANPDGSSIAEVMKAALANACVKPEDVLAIKAHGTATVLNDAGEIAGMRSFFGCPPPFFSLKAYMGHTLGSCGVMETALVAACLQYGQLPASGGFLEPDPELQIPPLQVPMVAEAGIYLLNFFGFGGSNTSLVLRYTH